MGTAPERQDPLDRDDRGDHLRVTLVQRASGLDPEANRAGLDVVAQVAGESDLVVFPEAFACDFGSPDLDLGTYAEPFDGPFVSRVQALSGAHGVSVVAGMFEQGEDPARPFNTLVCATPSGVTRYRKIHLYDSFGYRESDRLSAGALTPVVVDIGGFRVGLMTCYDLRFPELARALVADGAEVLVVPSAWVAGERKVEHWRTLAVARAIENTAYVVAVGQPEPRYTGHSLVVDPFGDVVTEADGSDGVVLTARLERDVLDRARAQNPSLTNRRM